MVNYSMSHRCHIMLNLNCGRVNDDAQIITCRNLFRSFNVSTPCGSPISWPCLETSISSCCLLTSILASSSFTVNTLVLVFNSRDAVFTFVSSIIFSLSSLAIRSRRPTSLDILLQQLGYNCIFLILSLPSNIENIN